ncbi:MAG: AAA family ATPase [Chloroflexota bacterium]
MSVVTIEGSVGSGAPDVGRIVAREQGLDFVDRLLLSEIARRVGSTVEALHESERRAPTRVERFAQLVQRMLERSSVAGSGGDPYFGPGIETLLARPYRELEDPSSGSSQALDEQRFISTTSEVIRDIAEAGNVVILSRGGGAILRDKPGVLRVGLVGQKEDRARRLMQRDQLGSLDEAMKLIEQSDKAQTRYFQKAFGCSPTDPFLYHVMWNTSEVSIEYAAAMISDATRKMAEQGLR